MDRLREVWFEQQFQTLNHTLDQINERLRQMSVEFDALVEQVNKQVDVEQSAMTLITGLVTKIDSLVASGASAAQFAELSQKLKNSAAALTESVLANTPAQSMQSKQERPSAAPAEEEGEEE